MNTKKPTEKPTVPKKRAKTARAPASSSKRTARDLALRPASAVRRTKKTTARGRENTERRAVVAEREPRHVSFDDARPKTVVVSRAYDGPITLPVPPGNDMPVGTRMVESSNEQPIDSKEIELRENRTYAQPLLFDEHLLPTSKNHLNVSVLEYCAHGLRIERYWPHTQYISKTKLIIYPWLFSTDWTMERFARSLAHKTFECHAITPFGHGSSAAPADFGKMSLADHISKLDAFVRSFPERMVLIGHSMGARVCNHVAAMHPRKVKGLVLIGCPAPRRFIPIPRLGWGCMIRSVKHLKKIHRHEPFFLTKDDARETLFNRLPQKEAESAWSMLGPGSGKVAWEILIDEFPLKPIACQSHVIEGSHDRFVSNGRRVQRILGPNASYKEVDASHGFMYSNHETEQVAAETTRWLEWHIEQKK